MVSTTSAAFGGSSAAVGSSEQQCLRVSQQRPGDVTAASRRPTASCVPTEEARVEPNLQERLREPCIREVGVCLKRAACGGCRGPTSSKSTGVCKTKPTRRRSSSGLNDLISRPLKKTLPSGRLGEAIRAAEQRRLA
jgi:hypothetical protein